MARHSSLRAADSDRDAVTERLRNAAAEGRLEPDELEDRVHTALRARTYGELDLVLADLPPARRRGAELVPAAQAAVVVAGRLVLSILVVSLMLLQAALTVTWWVLLRAHGYTTGRLSPPRRPARLL
jgi:uncharacterized protein DUF1707